MFRTVIKLWRDGLLADITWKSARIGAAYIAQGCLALVAMNSLPHFVEHALLQVHHGIVYSLTFFGG